MIIVTGNEKLRANISNKLVVNTNRSGSPLPTFILSLNSKLKRYLKIPIQQGIIFWGAQYTRQYSREWRVWRCHYTIKKWYVSIRRFWLLSVILINICIICDLLIFFIVSFSSVHMLTKQNIVKTMMKNKLRLSWHEEQWSIQVKNLDIFSLVYKSTMYVNVYYCVYIVEQDPWVGGQTSGGGIETDWWRTKLSRSEKN